MRRQASVCTEFEVYVCKVLWERLFLLISEKIDRRKNGFFSQKSFSVKLIKYSFPTNTSNYEMNKINKSWSTRLHLVSQKYRLDYT